MDSVAGEEDPTIGKRHDHTDVPRRVAGQRDDSDRPVAEEICVTLVHHNLAFVNAAEVREPVDVVIVVQVLLHEFPLWTLEMDSRIPEGVQAPCVIEMRMREDNVGHFRRSLPDTSELLNDRILLRVPRHRNIVDEPVDIILQPTSGEWVQAGVNQYQVLVVLDKEGWNGDR